MRWTVFAVFVLFSGLVFAADMRPSGLTEAETRAEQATSARADRQAARAEAERKAAEEAERQARLEAERKAAEEAERQARLEAERRAAEEAERQARLEAERKAAEEAERQARLEAERKAAEEAERQARLEAERKAAEEAERQARLEAERKAAAQAAASEKQSRAPSMIMAGVAETTASMGARRCVAPGTIENAAAATAIADAALADADANASAPAQLTLVALDRVKALAGTHSLDAAAVTRAYFSGVCTRLHEIGAAQFSLEPVLINLAETLGVQYPSPAEDAMPVNVSRASDTSDEPPSTDDASAVADTAASEPETAAPAAGETGVDAEPSAESTAEAPSPAGTPVAAAPGSAPAPVRQSAVPREAGGSERRAADQAVGDAPGSADTGGPGRAGPDGDTRPESTAPPESAAVGEQQETAGEAAEPETGASTADDAAAEDVEVGTAAESRSQTAIGSATRQPEAQELDIAAPSSDGTLGEAECRALGVLGNCPDLNAVLDQLLEKPLEYNHPEEMLLGQSTEIGLVLRTDWEGADLPSEVSEELKRLPGEVRQGLSKITRIMSAELTGRDFEISPAGRQERTVSPPQPASWNWQVTPKETGTEQVLKLRLYAHLQSPQGTMPPLLVKTLDATINVDVTTWDWVVNQARTLEPIYAIGAALIGLLTAILTFMLSRRHYTAAPAGGGVAERESEAHERSGGGDQGGATGGPVIGDLSQSAADSRTSAPPPAAQSPAVPPVVPDDEEKKPTDEGEAGKASDNGIEPKKD